MKKLMLMSALAGAILITTATTSCKKGDQGPAGANGVAGKDAKAPATPEAAKLSMKSHVAVYTSAVTALTKTPGLEKVELAKLADVEKLVSTEEKNEAIAAAKALTTTAIKNKAVAAAKAKLKALDILKNSILQLANVTANSKVNEIFTAYEVQAKIHINADPSTTHINAFNQIAVVVEKDKYIALLKDLDCIKANTTETILEATNAAISELKVANELKTLTTKPEIDAAVAKAEGIELTDVYGAKLTDETTAVSKNQKAAVKAYLAAKTLVVSLIEESMKAHSLSFKDLGITEELQKELGLVAATAPKSKN